MHSCHNQVVPFKVYFLFEPGHVHICMCVSMIAGTGDDGEKVSTAMMMLVVNTMMRTQRKTHTLRTVYGG